ncbi:PQQ-binding-like beta-propeller repeat protein [Nocardia sp. NPDC051833]|uniref:outer membrane protein assembly factor BamB family protein n=1 Tax=Nocardia sp. NPDC051833 TaxID=3155674 RepID=UPI00341AB462
MSDDQSTVPARSPWPVLAGLAGAVLVAGGIALALYSQFVAAPIPVPVDHRYAEAGDFPFRLVRGTLILAGAAVLIGAVVLVRGRRGDERAAGFTAGGVLALLAVLIGGGVFAVTAHIPSTYQRLTSVFVLTPRVSSAIAALALVLIGALLAFAFVATPTAPMPRRSALAAAVVVGLLPVFCAAGIAVRLGDDTAAVDHVTADPGSQTAVPAVPAALGPERFRLRIPADPSHPNRTLVTRTGFVVSTPDGIAVYDGVTGAERWHYRRSGIAPDKVWNRHAETLSLRGEDVVLTAWNKRGWMAFDAATGDLLWTDGDFSRDSRSTIGGPLLATVSSSGRVTRYDARTGNALWTSPAEPAGCAATERHVGTTTTAIYRAATCGAGDSAALVVTAFDPPSGAVRDQRTVAAPGLRPTDLVEVQTFRSGFVWVMCRRDDGDIDLFLPPNQPLTAAVVDSSRKNSDVRAADSAALIRSYDPDGPTLPDRWEILPAADGAGSTRLDMSATDSRPGSDDATALLADQVVALTWDNGYKLRTWDRSTGSAGPVLPVDIAPGTRNLRFTTVAGALLLIATDAKYRDIEVIGFS